MQPSNRPSVSPPELPIDGWQFMEVWVEPFLTPPYLLLLLSDAAGRCRICDPVQGYKLVFTGTYEEAKQWLLEDAYEPIEGRLWQSELEA